MFRKTIWTLPARLCVPCNLHVGICRQCLEFSPSLRTRCCNTFRRLRCRNRRDGRIFDCQPLSLLFVKPKQRLDVPQVRKGGIAIERVRAGLIEDDGHTFDKSCQSRPVHPRLDWCAHDAADEKTEENTKASNMLLRCASLLRFLMK